MTPPWHGSNENELNTYLSGIPLDIVETRMAFRYFIKKNYWPTLYYYSNNTVCKYALGICPIMLLTNYKE